MSAYSRGAPIKKAVTEICIGLVVTLRKASMVQTAHRMFTDRTTAQAMMPAQKRSRTIQMSDRNIPAASPVASALLHKVWHKTGLAA